MQQLPNADAVRAARKLAVESERAALLISRCGSAKSALNLLSQQLQHLPALAITLPAEPLIAEAIELFPSLAAVLDIAPTEDDDMPTRIRKRHQQVASIEQMLDPIAAQQHARGHAVHHLQQEQSKLLSLPEWAELRMAIAERQAAAAEATRTIGPLRTRLGQLSPLAQALARFVPEVQADLDHLEQDPGRITFAVRRMRALLSSLHDLSRSLALETHMPSPADIPDAERNPVEQALAQLRVFEVAVVEERDSVASELDRAENIVTDSNNWILERTG